MDHTSPAPTRTDRTLEADVVVVGARCAGAASAMLLADAGHDVLVLDRSGFPSDTVSTHVLSRTAMVQLTRWGLLDPLLATGAPPLTTVAIEAGGERVVRTVKDRHGVDHLLAPRRVVLDGVLQDAARRSGARLVTGVAVDGVLRGPRGRVVGVHGHDTDGAVRVFARFVVGADGLGSRVARTVGAPVTLERPSSGATTYAYLEGPWSAIEYHVVPGAFAGLFPTHGGEACVWISTPEEVARRHQRSTNRDRVLTTLLAEHVPRLADLVGGARQTSPMRGMLRMPNHVRQPSGPGWALVGDAGYHRDAITGYGISDAFRDAELLSTALDAALRDPREGAAALATYGLERERMVRPVLDLTCELGTFPPPERFVELQRQLATVIDEQAGELASRPSRVQAAVA